MDNSSSSSKTMRDELTLSEEFLEEFRQLEEQLERMFREDLFQGAKLEATARAFIQKHSAYLKRFPFLSKLETKYPNQGYYETLDEDYRLLCNERNLVESDIPDYANVLSRIYSYAAGGCYLRVMYNTVINERPDDRKEPVDLARIAIRYNPISNEWAIAWYLYSLGRHLDNTKNPKERCPLGRNFKQAAILLQKLAPNNCWGHNLLGRYMLSIANLSWLERQVWKSLLTLAKPDEYTFKEAEEELMKAYEMDKTLNSNALWMARILLAQKRPMEEVKKWIELGLTLKPIDPITYEEERELHQLKNKLKLDN